MSPSGEKDQHCAAEFDHRSILIYKNTHRLWSSVVGIVRIAVQGNLDISICNRNKEITIVVSNHGNVCQE